MTRPLAILLLLVAAFCGYGFLASFEHGPSAIYFRIGYATIGFLCLFGVLALCLKPPANH